MEFTEIILLSDKLESHLHKAAKKGVFGKFVQLSDKID